MELVAIDLMAHLWFVLKYLIVAVAVVVFISGVDDLFVDLAYLCIVAKRRLVGSRRFPDPPSRRRLRSKPEKRLVIIVPAWDESSVIGRMIDNSLRTLDYGNFHIIAGSYPNDPDTAAEIDRYCRQYPNVHRAEVGHDGPTSKADCLNWIVQKVHAVERDLGERFDAVVMQDAEDVVHPLALRVVNWAIESADMVQMPVFSLPRRRSEWVGSHYMDEFAEWHTKDLLVREALTRIVPSAGVATAFSRKALERLCEGLDNMPFNTDSLTEDYDVGQRLRRFGLNSRFVRYELRRPNTRGRGRGLSKVVATREFFPSDFGSAVRQKSRWTLGISFLGWEQLGWQGSLANRYFLYRDRKALWTMPATVLAYLVVLQIVLYSLQATAWSQGVWMHPLVEQQSWAWYLVMANLPFLVNRVAQRMWFVGRLYGPVDALLSVPRILVSNVIGFAAWWRACRRYLRYRRSGEALTWDKTNHAFPSLEEIGIVAPSGSATRAPHEPPASPAVPAAPVTAIARRSKRRRPDTLDATV